MKKEFVEYLKSIGITTDEYLKRIENIMEDFSEICQDDIIDIFVDEYIKEDGTREYEGITFFSKKYEFGVINFLTEDNFYLTETKKKTTSIRIKKQNYDFKKATEKSRLYMETSFQWGETEGVFKASKENCDFLKQIILKYFMPSSKE